MTESDKIKFAKVCTNVSSLSIQALPAKYDALEHVRKRCFYFPALGLIKISTLLLFDRIFPIQKFHRILQAVGLLILVYSTISMIVMIFQCRPLQGAWDPAVESVCIDLSKLVIFMGCMNVLTDFLLLCLPLPPLWKLQMRRGTKMQVISVFSIGSLSVTQSLFVSFF